MYDTEQKTKFVQEVYLKEKSMDRRQKKTREAIFKAFSSLLSKKNFNQISVQEIIDEADVGRATFYAHFETKDFLLKSLCEELFDHVIASAVGHSESHCHFSDCNAPSSVFLHLLWHLQKNDNNILELLCCPNNELFLQYFKTDLQKLVKTQLDRRTAASLGLPEDYLVNHISSSFVETVSWWLRQGMKDSPETITKYFLTAIVPIDIR